MWKRLRVRFARWLTRGTKCSVVRTDVVHRIQAAATELDEYINRSGGLQDPRRINAWRCIYALSAEIRAQSWDAEVAA